MAAVTAIVPGTARASGTAFESRTGRTTAAIGTATTAVWTTTAATITTAALWPLESGARVAADARGIARKIFARSGGPADTRGASFARKQNDIVLENRCFRDGFTDGCIDHLWCGMFGDTVLGITEGNGMLGALVCGVGFEFGTIGGAARFDIRGFFLGKLGLRGGLVFGSVLLCILLPFFFFRFFLLFVRKFGFWSSVNLLSLFLIEFGATGESVSFGVIGCFLVFRLGQFGGERHGLFFTQIDVGAKRLRRGRDRESGFVSFARSRKRRNRLRFRAIRFQRGFGFRAGFGEKPAGKST